jgi:hypothetical protein
LKDFANNYFHAGRYYYRPGHPILRVVSSLAEGADRYVALEGISLGYELQCPLPFSREEYARDFAASEESAREFRTLLADSHTTSVLELDGKREDEEGAYLMAGRAMLSQCDVLLAIWNGQEAYREGGTAQIVAEAGERNIPTIRIDSAGPHDVYIRVSAEKWSYSKDSLDWLRDQLEVLLTPPNPTKQSKGTGEAPATDSEKQMPDEVNTTIPRDYFRETRPLFNWGFFWKPFRDLWLLRFSHPDVVVPRFDSSGRKEWLGVVKGSGAFSESAKQRIVGADLYDHYGWANGLAEYYGNRYRSAFVTNYLLGACAVVCAFIHFSLPHFHTRILCLGVHPNPWYFALGEVLCLSVILAIYMLGRRRRWHERWIDYRLLAEYLRQLFLLIPLGPGELSSPHLPKYMSSGDPKNTWMYWHYLALRREIGLTSGEFRKSYLESVRAFLNSKEGIKGQVHYHETNEARLEKLDGRFATVGLAMFAVAFVLALVALCSRMDEGMIKLFSKLTHLDQPCVELLIGLCATALPAFGAALAGIRSQGEFERVKKRSKAMLQTLRRICTQLDECTNHQELSFAVLSVIAADAGQLMVDELLDWRIVFKDRPLPEPG